jgi:hypothetical protein
MHESLPSYSVRTCTAPSGTSRAHSASSAARRSSPTSPVPTRTSRCSRFLAAFPSGTRWKYSRGPTPEGSPQANHESLCSGGCERVKSSHVANPSGGGGTTYPNTSHQKRARRSGSAQSKVTWNFLIADIGATYQGDSAAHFPRWIRPQPLRALGHLGHQVIKPDSPRERRDPGGGAHRWPPGSSPDQPPSCQRSVTGQPLRARARLAVRRRQLRCDLCLHLPCRVQVHGVLMGKQAGGRRTPAGASLRRPRPASAAWTPAWPGDGHATTGLSPRRVQRSPRPTGP